MIEKKINLLIVILLFSLKINAQENEFTRSSIKTGIGVGINDGIEESGLGFVYSVGYQFPVCFFIVTANGPRLAEVATS